MSVFQVLDVRSLGEENHLQLVPNPGANDPVEFESQGSMPAYFGSQAIVRLAVSLNPLGYVPIDVTLVDHRFERIDPGEVSTEAQELMRRIREKGFESAMSYLARELTGLMVESLTLRGKGKKAGKQVRILQDGIIEFIAGDPSEADVQRALNAG